MPTSNTKLTEREKRYCRCLMKVSAKGRVKSPYGICTASVYNKQGVTRNRVVPCSENYKFENYTLPQLRKYASSRKISGTSRLNQPQLADRLYRYVKEKYKPRRGTYPAYLKEYRQAHPKMSLENARKNASAEYKVLKGK
jgi:hypothetical protein